MTSEEHNAINQAAAHKLKAIIDSSYPLKQFVAIAGGQIVADDGDFDKLQAKLAALGRVGTHHFTRDPNPDAAGWADVEDDYVWLLTQLVTRLDPCRPARVPGGTCGRGRSPAG